MPSRALIRETSPLTVLLQALWAESGSMATARHRSLRGTRT